MKRITAKLGNMRKAKDWVVYPASKGTGDTLTTIQCDTRIAAFDAATGDGWLSANKSSGAYFVHLSPALGATKITVPADVIAAALDAQPKSGDTIHGVVTIA